MIESMEAQAPEGITVYGTSWCPDCHLARSVLDGQGTAYRWVDIDEHPEAVEVVLSLNGGLRRVPTIVFPDGQILVEPSRPRLLEFLNQESSQ
jgi:glutaredoxin-like protein